MNKIRKDSLRVLSGRKLGKFEGLYTKMYVINYLLQMGIDFLAIIYRFENNLLNKNAASFHIKEQLILYILTKLSKLIDQYALDLNRRDPGLPQLNYNNRTMQVER